MDSNIYVYINGTKTSLMSLAASSGISYATILARYKAGVAPANLTAGVLVAANPAAGNVNTVNGVGVTVGTHNVQLAIGDIATVDTAPVSGSANLVSSGGVFAAIKVYDAGTTYPSGAYCIYAGNIWTNTSSAPATGVTPGSDYNIWNVGYCNKNLLDNWDFRNPVNQREKTTYPATIGAQYTVDRWRTISWYVRTVVNSGYITLSEMGGGAQQSAQMALQTFERSLFDNIYTASIMLSSGSIVSGSGEINANNALVISIPGSNCELIVAKSYFLIYATAAGASISVAAVKLELGSVSTLANDPPADFGMELAKCQRYYEIMDIRETTGFNKSFSYKVTKRTNPTITFVSPSGTVGKVGIFDGTTWVDSDPGIPAAGIESVSLFQAASNVVLFTMRCSSDL